jgi:hypothetical protein
MVAFVIVLFGWSAFLAVVAYRLRGHDSFTSAKRQPRHSDRDADSVYLPDIGHLNSELGIHFDPEAGYSTVVVPETVPVNG